MPAATLHAAGLGVAFGCGLLLGIEREQRRGRAGVSAPAGVRTFSLTALAGGLAAAAGTPLLALTGLFIGALILMLYRRAPAGAGITTELALFASFLLGAAAMDSPALAAASAVVVAATLNLRGWLHHVARDTLQPGELRDALLLAGAALVIRPLLPDASAAWLLGVNPRTLWTVALVILCIQSCADVALRLAGPRLGLALAGFGSGLISSIATTAAMGTRARANVPLRGACVAGALMSNVATFVLLWLVALSIAPERIGAVLPSLACGTLAAAIVGAVSLQFAGAAQDARLASSRAFRIPQALLYAAGLCGASLMVAYVNARLGADAGMASVALAGLFDVHAAASSALSLLAGGAASESTTVLALLLAISANMGSKVAAAALSGGAGYALRVGPALLLVLAAAWLPFLLAGPDAAGSARAATPDVHRTSTNQDKS